MNTGHDSFNELRARGFRLTPQRFTILDILKAAGRHLTPVQVYERAAQALPGLTEPTVYRTLSFLTDQGLVHATHIGGGQIVYEYAGQTHHHLLCRACNQMLEIGHEQLEPLYQEVESSCGFKIDTVHVTFFGLCKQCQQLNNKREAT